MNPDRSCHCNPDFLVVHITLRFVLCVNCVCAKCKVNFKSCSLRVLITYDQCWCLLLKGDVREGQRGGREGGGHAEG